ncbi:DnaJ-domain-containing protein [Clathrospora elynae]|uniref:DnaJ-domain-containing protein n=1 Tax=Clathrospora elynae TaxID=706981 RepID=A0A6A5SQX6_9PLEO|nr:DnaJ-domain-containing protein [Clathrospora elynae]
MQTQSFYETLGLAPNAPPEVIRAAYKTLALIYHPDRTLELTASNRASHAAVFRNVREAFDVLSNVSTKAAYDAELIRYDGDVDEEFSIFYRRTPYHATLKRKMTMKLTTPKEKEAITARARQQLEYLREQRAKRDDEEAHLGSLELKHIVHIWLSLAEENGSDPAIKGYCTIRAHEYGQKVAERERQHDEWLAKISKSRHTPVTPKTKEYRSLTSNAPEKIAAVAKGYSSCDATYTHTPSSRINLRYQERKRIEEKQTEAAAKRAQARIAENFQREAAKQAIIDQKAAEVRVEKDKQRQKVQEHARLNYERISRARAKVHAAP